MIEKLKEFYAFAKKNLNPIRFVYNYIMLPITFTVGFLLMILTFIFLIVSPSKFLIASIVMFSIILVLCVISFLIMPFVVRAKERKIEAKHLTDFFNMKLEENPNLEYVLSAEEKQGIIPLHFTKTGFVIDSNSYSYNDFEVGLFTSNYLYRVNLIILFSKKSDEKKEDKHDEKKEITSFSLPLDINLLSIIKNFDIKLANKDVLLFIKDYPEIASKQILKWGRIQNNYDKYKTR